MDIAKLYKCFFTILVKIPLFFAVYSHSYLGWAQLPVEGPQQKSFFEIKISGELNLSFEQKLHHIRASATIGKVVYFNSSKSLFGNYAFSASALLGRGLGASMRDPSWFVRPQGVVTLGLGWQGGGRLITHEVTQFTSLTTSSFRSDYSNVLSLATNLVLVDMTKSQNSNGKKFNRKYLTQRVGSLFASFNHWEVSYCNDGPIFSKWAGDGKDRYWTGSGFFGYKFKDVNVWGNSKNNLVKLSFDRYTSYIENAYELATALKLDHTPYRDEAALYNRGSLRLGYFSNQIFGEVSFNDYDSFDIQNLLHIAQGFAFHRTASNSTVSIRGGLKHERLLLIPKN